MYLRAASELGAREVATHNIVKFCPNQMVCPVASQTPIALRSRPRITIPPLLSHTYSPSYHHPTAALTHVLAPVSPSHRCSHTHTRPRITIPPLLSHTYSPPYHHPTAALTHVLAPVSPSHRCSHTRTRPRITIPPLLSHTYSPPYHHPTAALTHVLAPVSPSHRCSHTRTRPHITIPPLLSHTYSPPYHHPTAALTHVLGLPRPDPLEELGAAEVVPRLSLFLPHALLDHHLGGDAGVVTTRVPQHRLPPHPVPDTRHSRGLTNILTTYFK